MDVEDLLLVQYTVDMNIAWYIQAIGNSGRGEVATTFTCAAIASDTQRMYDLSTKSLHKQIR